MMKRITHAAAALLVALLASWSVPTQAQDLNPLEKTYLTFSGPVELPGMTLPAGTYTFKLADTPGRNVIQVLSRDEGMIHGQFLFVQAQRPDVTGETVVMFHETAEGTTPAVQYWYYPGERIGKEFVYPKDQAMRIAARTHMPVRSSEGDRFATVDDRGNTTPFEQSPAQPESVQARANPAPPAPAPAAPPAFQAPRQPNPVPESAPAPAPAPRREAIPDTLPQTASPMPLVGFAGFLAFAAALSLRAFRA